MKHKYYMLTALILLSSCSDFLNREPMVTLSPKQFWKTENDLRLALNAIYLKMNQPFYLDVQTIDCFGAVGDHVSSGTYTPVNRDIVWTNAYEQIRITNNFLENYQNASLAEKVKNRYAGEARFFRAYFYYLLIKRFGDVPYVDKTLNLESEELYNERTSVRLILDKIIEDLLYAEEHIPLKSEISRDVGRITKGTAQALLGRIALYYGTYYKFRGDADYSTYLSLAKDVSRRLIDANEYALFKDYRALFLMDGEDSDEHILSYRYSEKANTFNIRIRSTIVDFSQRPTKYLADAFLCKDGLPIEKSSYKVKYLPIGAEFEDRDPRMSQTIWRPGDPFLGNPFLPNLSNQTKTGYMFKKYGDEGAYTNIKATIDDILIRYSEVLLSYAEATYELNDMITDEDLSLSINALRNRFEGQPNKLPALTNDFVLSHQLDMREEIRRERRVEFASESLRYDDLIRWKTAEIELPKEILGAKFDSTAYRDIVPGKDVLLNEDGFILVQSASSRGFDVNKNYLFPLPLEEIALNPKLKQNPNW